MSIKEENVENKKIYFDKDNIEDYDWYDSYTKYYPKKNNNISQLKIILNNQTNDKQLKMRLRIIIDRLKIIIRHTE